MAKWNFIAIAIIIIFVALANSFSATMGVVQKDTDLMLWGCSASSDRELCLTLLRSDPRSYSAKNYTAVGQIMVEFALAKANETQAFVISLAGKTTDKAVGESLAVCRRVYDRIIHEHLPNALETSTVSEEDASKMLGDALSDENNCEKEFGRNHVVSMLTQRNQDFSAIAMIAQNIWFLVWS